MFGKKASEPRQPTPVRLITSTHIIEGNLDPGVDYVYLPVHEKVDTTEVWKPLALNNVTLHSLRPADVAPRSVTQFMARGDQIIALVPMVGVPIAGYSGWKEYKKPVTGTYYFGPYLIQGTMNFLTPLHIQHMMPMTDLHITALQTEPNFVEMRVPFALVNTRWMMGYEPATTP
jgi:hypothetical protein